MPSFLRWSMLAPAARSSRMSESSSSLRAHRPPHWRGARSRSQGDPNGGEQAVGDPNGDEQAVGDSNGGEQAVGDPNGGEQA
eukprot:4126392-Prymnesium_polylepis.1